jgi:hypothetical protein
MRVISQMKIRVIITAVMTMLKTGSVLEKQALTRRYDFFGFQEQNGEARKPTDNVNGRSRKDHSNRPRRQPIGTGPKGEARQAD